MEIRKTVALEEIARAVAIDRSVVGSDARAGYISSVATCGGLSVALLDSEIQAFSCLDENYFFGKPFISLLIVSPDARRLGLGANLLSHCACQYAEVWTSTNRSNDPMRALLDEEGWHFRGEVSGLDEGDPELFYKHVGA